MGVHMGKKHTILTVAAALAAFPYAPAVASMTPAEPAVGDPSTEPSTAAKPNVVYQAGEDLLGLVVTKRDDGTVVAQHASHASHASHHSHYSSR
jgi:hypothetical protein